MPAFRPSNDLGGMCGGCGDHSGGRGVWGFIFDFNVRRLIFLGINFYDKWETLK